MMEVVELCGGVGLEVVGGCGVVGVILEVLGDCGVVMVVVGVFGFMQKLVGSCEGKLKVARKF